MDLYLQTDLCLNSAAAQGAAFRARSCNTVSTSRCSLSLGRRAVLWPASVSLEHRLPAPLFL